MVNLKVNNFKKKLLILIPIIIGIIAIAILILLTLPFNPTYSIDYSSHINGEGIIFINPKKGLDIEKFSVSESILKINIPKSLTINILDEESNNFGSADVDVNTVRENNDYQLNVEFNPENLEISGSGTLTIQLKDKDSAKIFYEQTHKYIIDDVAPSLSEVTGEAGTVTTAKNKIIYKTNKSEEQTLNINFDGYVNLKFDNQSQGSDTNFKYAFIQPDDKNSIRINYTATDRGKNELSGTIEINFDNASPNVKLKSESVYNYSNTSNITAITRTVSFISNEPLNLLKVDNKNAKLTDPKSNIYEVKLTLNKGENSYKLHAEDYAGNIQNKTVKIKFNYTQIQPTPAPTRICGIEAHEYCLNEVGAICTPEYFACYHRICGAYSSCN